MVLNIDVIMPEIVVYSQFFPQSFHLSSGHSVLLLFRKFFLRYADSPDRFHMAYMHLQQDTVLCLVHTR